MPRGVLQLFGQVHHQLGHREVADVAGSGWGRDRARGGGLDVGCRLLASGTGDGTQLRRPVVALLDHLAPGVLLPGRVAERLGDVADRGLGAVGDHVRDLGRVAAVVAFVDVLDRLLAPVGLDVEVDVGRPVALRRQEAFEQQPVAHRVHSGDADGVADRGVRRAAPALAQDVAAAAELHDLPDHQEVAGEPELIDDLQFVLDLVVGVDEAALTGPAGGLLPGAVPVQRPGVGEFAQVGHLGVARRDRERGEIRGDELEREREVSPERAGPVDRPGPAVEAVGHLGPAAEMGTGPGRQPAVDVVQGAPGADRRDRRGQGTARGMGVVRRRGGDGRQPGAVGQVGKGIVQVVGEGVQAMGELHRDVARPEEGGEFVQRPPGRLEGEGTGAA